VITRRIGGHETPGPTQVGEHVDGVHAAEEDKDRAAGDEEESRHRASLVPPPTWRRVRRQPAGAGW